MFSYLRVPKYIAKFNGNQRKSTRLKNYTSRLKENKVDRDSFSMHKEIEPFETRCIELPSNMETIKTQIKNLEPVVGNMNNDGWEVYEGINFKSDNMKSHSAELNHLIDNKQKHWKGISSTNRKMIILSNVERLNDAFKQNRTLYNAFDELLNMRLRKIPYLEEVQLDNMALFANIGIVKEQEPHRDFSSIKK